MPRLFVLVGIAGCGKSTWAQNNLGHYNMFNEILSSDIYRENLLNDINDQSQNELIFKTLYSDLIIKLKEGKSICIDATNLTRKSRRYIFNILNDNKIDCEKIAVLFEVEESIIRKQNSEREKKVPDIIIDKMFRSFEIPFVGEGFDRIDTVFKKYDNLIQYNEIPKLMKDFNQDNPHHSLTLSEHCRKCYNYLTKNDDVKDNLELLTASLIHDIGKLYTKEYDEKKGYCHFIGHENYGAYKSLFLNYDPLVIDREKVAFYINYHMEPYRLANAKEITIEKYQKLFSNEWDNLIALHRADEAAH